MKAVRLIDEFVRDKKITSCASSGEDIVASNANFKNVKVSYFMITSIHMDASHFNNCDLHEVYVSGGKGRNTVRECLFSDVHFDCMTFENILFERCIFERCSFSNICFGLHDNKFVGCQFSRCDLPKENPGFFYLTLANKSRPFDDSNIFSQCTGWASPSEFLARNFERNETNTGYIVYKTFGCLYTSPKEWMIIPGSIITENCDMNRMNTCSYGINVATLEWIRNNVDSAYTGIHRNSKSSFSIWRCEILDEWLADVCVPIGSDGKIRCGKLRLLETI